MKAMVLRKAGQPLRFEESPVERPGPDQVLIQVRACGVCRTDLHVADGDLTRPKLPLVLGHEIVGVVCDRGAGAERFSIGDRVGVPWLGRTCGSCKYCLADRENLCENPKFTGYDLDGGYAEYTLADEKFCFPIPSNYSEAEAAPLLCAGLIGHRSYVAAGKFQKLGIYGFGAAAHIITQIAIQRGVQVYAFTRPGDQESQRFARSMGASWAGDSNSMPPKKLDAAIIFAPVGPLIPIALKAVDKGGTVVCAGIHMTDVPAFPYRILWEERSVKSVANLTRRDGNEFLKIISGLKVRTEVTPFKLAQSNEALDAVRKGQIQGAAVIVPGS